MKNNSIIDIAYKSLKDLLKSPLIIILSLLILGIQFLYSKAVTSIPLFNSLQATWTNALLVQTLTSIPLLLPMSFIYCCMIGLAKRKVEKGKNEVLKVAYKKWLKNFLIILILLIVYNVVQWIAFTLAYTFGKLVGLSVETAQVVFFLFLFIGLIGIVIFLTFSSFYIVIYQTSIKNSLKKSAIFVKNNYLETLSILILFFIARELTSYAGVYSQYINAIIITPYLALILTRFLMARNAQK